MSLGSPESPQKALESLQEARDDRDHVDAAKHVGEQHGHGRPRRSEGTDDER